METHGVWWRKPSPKKKKKTALQATVPPYMFRNARFLGCIQLRCLLFLNDCKCTYRCTHLFIIIVVFISHLITVFWGLVSSFKFSKKKRNKKNNNYQIQGSNSHLKSASYNDQPGAFWSEFASSTTNFPQEIPLTPKLLKKLPDDTHDSPTTIGGTVKSQPLYHWKNTLPTNIDIEQDMKNKPSQPKHNLPATTEIGGDVNAEHKIPNCFHSIWGFKKNGDIKTAGHLTTRFFFENTATDGWNVSVDWLSWKPLQAKNLHIPNGLLKVSKITPPNAVAFHSWHVWTQSKFLSRHCNWSFNCQSINHCPRWNTKTARLNKWRTNHLWLCFGYDLLKVGPHDDFCPILLDLGTPRNIIYINICNLFRSHHAEKIFIPLFWFFIKNGKCGVKKHHFFRNGPLQE